MVREEPGNLEAALSRALVERAAPAWELAVTLASSALHAGHYTDAYDLLESVEPLVRADSVRDLRGLRRDLAARAAGSGLLDGNSAVLEDFLLAVDEMTTNALRHGRPPVDLSLWASVDRLVCRVTDHGSGLDDPFIGYGPAHGEDLSRGGMGLWLARQLCDHVDVTRTDASTSVRLIAHLR